MLNNYIFPLTHRRLPESVGTKAINLRRLKDRGLLIPESHVCTWLAFNEFLQKKPRLKEELISELNLILNPGQYYAIRSSANIEDGTDFSFAGQFQSHLMQQGLEQVLQAIWSIWRQAQSPQIQTYLERVIQQKGPLKMAVIVQDMVIARVSGVSFSRNPVTLLDEVVVEAVPGLGDSLVQDGVTPMRWIDKWGSWVHHSESETIDEALIREVVDQTRWIAKSFNMDVDLEWVYEGEQIYWLQMRKITAQNQNQIYSNRISKEMIPGLIKPLVWSVAIPVHSEHWLSIIQRVVGRKGLDFSNLIHPFYYRAYFNIGAFGQAFDLLGMPRESLEMMMGLLPPDTKKPHMKMPVKVIKHLPRISGFLFYLWNFNKHAHQSLEKLQAECRYIANLDISHYPDAELLQKIEPVLNIYRQSSYYTIIVQLLMHIYHRLLKSDLEDLGIDIHQFDLTENMPQLEHYDPAAGMRRISAQFHALPVEIQANIQQSTYQEFCKLSGIPQLQIEMNAFLEQFGHVSESTNDFSSTPWRENPDIVLRMVVHSLQPKSAQDTLVKYQELNTHGFRSFRLKTVYQRARLFRFYRDAFSSLFSQSLGLLRKYYLAVAEIWVNEKMLAEKELIFYLTKEEIQELCLDKKKAPEANTRAIQRRQEMEECRDILLPEIIHGEQAPPVTHQISKKLVGVASSRGYYRGTIKVVRSIDEFEKLEPGDVLVIPYSDVSWTPLFAKAGAVIAESGGLLSHSSIIAREYQIPAVVSVNGALQLTDGVQVSIDGYKGEVLILDGHPA